MKNSPMSHFPCPMSLIIILGFLITYSFAGPVSHFGALKRCSNPTNKLCGEKTGTSTPIFVKGPSLFWSDGSGSPFYNIETVEWLVDNFQIGVIRAAMAIRYYGENKEEINKAGGTPGYYFDAARQKALIKAVIDAAILNDIYVIVDWHSHVAHNETSSAKDFFVEIANAYKGVPNIIWEVYNEPMGASTSQVSSHAQTIISALRSAGNNNLAIIGSPTWSQKPEDQGNDWGSKDQNVAFAFHFYSVTHGSTGEINANTKRALNKGYAVFGSEWGGTNADGEGSFDGNSANGWTSWMDSEKISNCMWSASDAPKGNDYNSKEAQASAMFTRGTNSSNLAINKLTSSGQYFQTYMGKNKWTDQIPADHPKGNDISASVADGGELNLTSQLGLTGEVSAVSQPKFGTASFTNNSVKYVTSPNGSPDEKVRFTYKITKGNVTVQRKVTVTITGRLPSLPQKDPIAVSRRAPSILLAAKDLSASDPDGKTLSFKSGSLSKTSMGTVSVKNDTLTFTPDPSQYNVSSAEVTLTYTIQNTSGQSRSANVVLKLQNFAPATNTSIVNGCCAGSSANTAPIGIGVKQVGAKDKDNDSMWFDKLYLDPMYPGRIEKIKADSFVYYPENNKTGRVVFLAVVTDGLLYSNLGKSALNLTGNGTAIGTLTPPDNIPGYEIPSGPPQPPEPPEPPVPITRPSFGGEFAIKYAGFGNLELSFAQSGFAKLDVYSLSGKNVGNLLKGHQNAGSKTVSLGNLNLQKGIYILRLSQGSQVKIIRVVN